MKAKKVVEMTPNLEWAEIELKHIQLELQQMYPAPFFRDQGFSAVTVIDNTCRSLPIASSCCSLVSDFAISSAGT